MFLNSSYGEVAPREKCPTEYGVTLLPVQEYMFRPQVEDKFVSLLQKGGSSQRKVALRFIRSLGSLKREVTLQ